MKGLTLVEVLVALVVACVTMAAVARSEAAIRRGERDGALLETASRLAERGLEERIAHGPLALVEGQSSEAIDEWLGRFERRTIIDAGPQENLWHVTVLVSAPRGAGVRSVHTLIRRPWVAP